MATIMPVMRFATGLGQEQIIEVKMDSKLAELNMRRTVCQACIKVLDQAEDDPRKPEAMKEYKAQLAEIDAAIAEITGKPPPVVVGLKTAKLFGESNIK